MDVFDAFDFINPRLVVDIDGAGMKDCEVDLVVVVVVVNIVGPLDVALSCCTTRDVCRWKPALFILIIGTASCTIVAEDY